MNRPSNFPLSAHWRPREPSPTVAGRLFNRRPDRAPALATLVTRCLAQAAACLCAICVSLAQYAPHDLLLDHAERPGAPTMGAGLVSRIPPQNMANNRVARASGPILEWTNPAPINSTTGFLLQTFTNSAMF